MDEVKIFILKSPNFKWLDLKSSLYLDPLYISEYSGDVKSDHLKSGNIWNLDFLKVGFNCPDLKWLGFQFSDPIQNSDHLQPNLFWPFKMQTSLDFRSPFYSGFGNLFGFLESFEVSPYHRKLPFSLEKFLQKPKGEEERKVKNQEGIEKMLKLKKCSELAYSAVHVKGRRH